MAWTTLNTYERLTPRLRRLEPWPTAPICDNSHMASQPIAPKLTEEEYLRLERAAFEKSEYHEGEVFAMSGGSANHALLGASITFVLRRQLPPGCRVFNSEMRVKVPGKRTYLYPDAIVVCTDPDIADTDNLLNPQLIIEVLSPSTESYDRGKKFELYRAIPSFTDYLVIHQDRRHVEHHARQEDGGWLMYEYAGAGASVTLPRWNITIPLADLYAPAIGLEED